MKCVCMDVGFIRATCRHNGKCIPIKPIEKQPMRTKAEVALSALEQAILLTGAADKQRDDEFTVQEYADKIEMGIHASRRMLNKAIKDGKINVRKTTRNFFYSIA